MINYAVDLALITISLYGFISQLLRLKRNKSIGSFSIYFPHIILSCNILKIFFWLFKPFAISLLVQSFLLIIINLLLLKECVSLRQNHAKFKESYIGNAFGWKNFSQHILFILMFTLGFGLLTFVSVSNGIQFIGDILAYLSTLIEISQCLPQLVSSYKSKSISGVSRRMISIWLFVDSSKTVYFIANEQPLPFILTGSILIVLDLALIVQIIIYREKKVNLE